jgi:hypothetical protein
MRPNIGVINALCRITFGFTLLAWATASLARKPWRDSFLFYAMLGGMKVGEGITRYCPVTALFENNINLHKHHDTDEQEETAINPS